MQSKWEYIEAIPISDKENLTPYVFYEYFLPRVRESLYPHKRTTKISFDMTEIARINPLVIPNLLIVGKILREYLGYPVELILSRKNSDMIRFLESLGFFRILDKYNFFSYETGFVGGFTGEEFGNLGAILYVPIENLSADDIIYRLLKNNKEITAFLNHFNNENLANIFIYSLAELTQNAMFHGKSSAFICAYGGPKMGLQCAVSDCGVGYLNRLLQKQEDLKVFSKTELLENDKLNNYRAIIEAVFRRFDKKTYGLTSVIRGIAENGGTTRIHTDDTQVVFTKNNFHSQQGILGSIKEEGLKLYQTIFNLAKATKNRQSSPIRIRSTRLAGAHIEFEIPPLCTSEYGRI